MALENDDSDGVSRAVTILLDQMRGGDSDAESELLRVVYDELRRLAASRMRGVPASDTLQPTALVHEAYLRLLAKGGDLPENRRHFFAIAARAMRDIVVDQARRHAAIKRGGGRHRTTLSNLDGKQDFPVVELVALDEALTRLEEHDPDGARVVTLRFFAGLSIDETAALLDVSSRTVDRLWRYARAWLRRDLMPEE